MLKGNPDVIEVDGQGVVLLKPLALAMAAEVVPKRGHASFAQASSEPGEEATFLTSDTPTVNEQHGTVGRTVGSDQGAVELQAVKGADGGVGGPKWQRGLLSLRIDRSIVAAWPDVSRVKLDVVGLDRLLILKAVRPSSSGSGGGISERDYAMSRA
jgi:hypothetical protein